MTDAANTPTPGGEVDEAALTPEELHALRLQQLGDWQALKARIAADTAKEKADRAKLFDYFFPTPSEGLQRVELGGGWKLKGEYSINRTVDLPALTSYGLAKVAEFAPQLEAWGAANIEAMDPEAFVWQALNVPMADLMKQKTELSKSAYNKLTEVQRAFVECMLETKPGPKALEVEPPKEKK